MFRRDKRLVIISFLSVVLLGAPAEACNQSGGADDIHNCRGGSTAGSNNGDGGKADAYGRLGTAIGGFIGSVIELGRQNSDDNIVRRVPPTDQDRRNAAYSSYGNQIRSARSAADCALIGDMTARSICEEPFAAAINKNLNTRFNSLDGSSPSSSGAAEKEGAGGSWQSVLSSKPSEEKLRPAKSESIDPDSGMSASSCLQPSGSSKETYLSGDTRVCFTKSEFGRCEGYSVKASFFNSCKKPVSADIAWDHGKMGYVSVPGGQTGTALCTAEPNGVMCSGFFLANAKF